MTNTHTKTASTSESEASSPGLTLMDILCGSDDTNDTPCQSPFFLNFQQGNSQPKTFEPNPTMSSYGSQAPNHLVDLDENTAKSPG